MARCLHGAWVHGCLLNQPSVMGTAGVCTFRTQHAVALAEEGAGVAADRFISPQPVGDQGLLVMLRRRIDRRGWMMEIDRQNDRLQGYFRCNRRGDWAWSSACILSFLIPGPGRSSRDFAQGFCGGIKSWRIGPLRDSPVGWSKELWARLGLRLLGQLLTCGSLFPAHVSDSPHHESRDPGRGPG
jgi:hypothetical protein